MPIDMSLAAKAPPRKAAATSARTSARSAPVAETRTANEVRTEGLNGLGQIGQGLCLMFGLYADAAAIGQHFPPMAKEIANVSDNNEAVSKPVDMLIAVGPYGALIATAMPLVMQLMANHRMINADMLIGQGVVPPNVLEAQMKAQVMRMQSEALKAQQMAMREAANAEAEYNSYVAEQNGAKVG